MSFPYPLPALDLAVPFDRHRATVLPEWVDANGHMNMGYYLIAFDRATDTFCDQLGVGWAYAEHRLGMVFALEAHIVYERELRQDDPFRVVTQILAHDEKRLRLFHAMHHAAEGWRAAVNEVMLLHVDFDTRRAAPWPELTRQRLQAIAAAHAVLPRPEAAGRGIAMRRSRAGKPSARPRAP